MNTYTGQFDKNNGVKHWASYFRNHSVKKTFVQKWQNNDVPPNQIYTNLVTKASNPLTVIQHCPKVTTWSSVSGSTHLARQWDPLMFPQSKTTTTIKPQLSFVQLYFCQTQIHERMPGMFSFSGALVLLPSRFTVTKMESLTHGIIALLQFKSGHQILHLLITDFSPVYMMFWRKILFFFFFLFARQPNWNELHFNLLSSNNFWLTCTRGVELFVV